MHLLDKYIERIESIRAQVRNHLDNELAEMWDIFADRGSWRERVDRGECSPAECAQEFKQRIREREYIFE